MRRHRKPIRSAWVSRLWLAVFAFWLVLLSGVFSEHFGHPGIVQAFRLKSLIYTRQAQVVSLEKRIMALDLERRELQTNEYAQEREIRNTLGYAAPDEIIFDFTQSEHLSE